MNDFVIYSLENLFGVLRNVAAQNVNDYSIPLVVAENEFRKDFFSSVCNLGCAVRIEILFSLIKSITNKHGKSALKSN